MTRRAFVFGLLSALTIPSQALALREVIIGNQPLGPEFVSDKDVLAALNVEERVFLSVGGLVQDLEVYFKGGPKALNDAFRRFAAIPATTREIILMPVPAPPLVHTKPIPYDWRLYLPAVRQRAAGPAYDRVTLTVYIPEPLPPAPADPGAARRWIADLGSDDFKTRERAAKELAALGPPAARLLRQGLTERPSAEARERIEKLLAGMCREIRPDVLDLPAGVPVVSLDDLLDRALNGKDRTARSNGVWALVRHGATADALVPVLEKMLNAETEEAPLSAAAWAAGRLGAGGRPLLPALRTLTRSKDKAVASTAVQAVDQIERAKAEPVPEVDARKRATIRREIQDLAAERSSARK